MPFRANIESIYNRLVEGLSHFFKESGSSKAILGLSGGIDSAVVLPIAVEALGSSNVTALLMPSPYSTVESVTDAVELATNLGVAHPILPIEGIYNRYMKELNSLFCGDVRGITTENLQARIRGTLLMAHSNNSGALLLNTTNKSELAVGYGTLYGDLTGAVMVLADLYKLQVYAVAEYINRERQIIPNSIMVKEPSAELRDNQKDSDTLPPYSTLDPILYGLIEEGKGAEELIVEGYDRESVERVVKLRGSSQFKYLQTPPLLQMGNSPLFPSYKLLKYF